MNNVTLNNTALERIHEIREKEINHGKFLRVSISGGGCSGFQYIFELDNKKREDDVELAKENSEIIAVTDTTSLPFLDGAEIEFVKELGAAYFKVKNPNAKASCGCGSSFSI
jgi:iron-sulfur cluster assembly accessory protein